MTPSPFQYETASPLCSPGRESFLIVETFEFVAQPARPSAQRTRILLKRPVKTFLLFISPLSRASDSRWHVIQRGIKAYVNAPKSGISLRQLILVRAIDDVEAQNARSTAKNDQEASQALKHNQSLRAELDLAKLARRFVYAIRGAGEVDGRDCWIVGYGPKAGTSAGSREEKVINALRGQLWIDKETFSILRCEGKTAEPVTVALIATVDPLEFSYESQRLSNGEVVPRSVDVAITMKAPFFLRTSATSLYTQQLSHATRQLNADSILRTFAPLATSFRSSAGLRLMHFRQLITMRHSIVRPGLSQRRLELMK
jgi:hypothetical protein